MKYFDYEYRVRYADTDKMGITYYANYLVWFEAARTEYFRKLGLPYTQCEEKGYYLPVVEASLKYISTCTYDDEIIIRTSVSKIQRTSMKFDYQVRLKSDQKLINEGHSIHVFVDKNMKPCRIPADIKEKVTAFELLKK